MTALTVIAPHSCVVYICARHRYVIVWVVYVGGVQAGIWGGVQAGMCGWCAGWYVWVVLTAVLSYVHSASTTSLGWGE